MKKKLSVLLFAFIITFTFLSGAVSADMGPKPSVNIVFKNMSNETCYGTLLSQGKTTGPYSVYEGDDKNADDITLAFRNYDDSDGFYYLETYQPVGKNKSYNWGYYPPKTFKVLLYFPEENFFVSSGIVKTYTFTSKYIIDLNNLQIGAENQLLEVNKDQNLGKDILGFLIRLVLTVIIEFFIALAFNFNKKGQIIFIIIVNTVTQIALNVLLYKAYNAGGGFLFTIAYILLEFVIFNVEGVAYSFGLEKFTGKDVISAAKCFGYSFTANLASFFIGMFISIIFMNLIF